MGEFGRFVAATGYKTEAERNPEQGLYAWDAGKSKWAGCKGKSWREPRFSQDDRHPVVGVSWNDAQAYIQWLREKSGKGFRLPSEGEWEYAARAGTATARFWGDDPNHACRYASGADGSAKGRYRGLVVHDCDDGYVETGPVGRFEPNRFGLYDMPGNVWEWVQDCWHDDFSGAPDDGRSWETGDRKRQAIRGGYWGNEPRNFRCAARSWVYADYRGYNLGFRLARD